MSKEILTFRDIEIEKEKNYRNKIPILLKDVHIAKVLVSSKISLREKDYKYFLGYLHNNDELKLLNIMLPKKSANVKSYDGKTKWIYIFFD